LLFPLGPWHHTTHRLDFVLYQPELQVAYQAGHDRYWRKFSSINTRPYRTTRLFHLDGIAVTLPPDLHLARLEARTDSTITLSGSSQRDPQASASTLPWPLQHGHFDQTILLAQAMAHGTAIAISDGSYMPSRYPSLAAAAWVIHSGATPAAVSYGVTQVHGQPSMVNSYRAELQGMYSLILAINHICSLHQLTAGHLLVGCDNQGVIDHLQKRPSYVPGSTKHADLVRAIHNAHQACPIRLQFQYVAGHQDNFLRVEDLPLLAQLNVQADLMAKQALHSLGLARTPPLLTPIPDERWALQISDLPISLDPRSTILDHLSRQTALPYWIQKGFVSAAAAPSVDWELLGTALSTRPPTYQMWASKFASGHSAVGCTMAHWKRWDSPACPFCQHPAENTLHVLLCPHPTRTAVWHQAVEDLRTWLVDSDTSPVITSCIVPALHARGSSQFSSHAALPCSMAASTQDQIGFFPFMLGCLSPQWELLQSVYWSSSRGQRSSHLWAKRLCLQLLHLTHSVWVSRNQQLQVHRESAEQQLAEATIRQEFERGTLNLLPQDTFYVQRSSPFEGFTLASVLALPLPDQQLWIHSIQNARARGSALSTAELSQMQSSFRQWLLPST